MGEKEIKESSTLSFFPETHYLLASQSETLSSEK